MNPWRYFNISLLLVGPLLLMILVVTPGETWRDLRFCFDPRIIRLGLRFRAPWKWRFPRPTFSIRALMIITALIALQQGFLLQFQGAQRWAMFVLTSIAVIVFVATAVLTSCNIPRRRYRQIYQRPSTRPEIKNYPAIDVPGAQKIPLSDSACRKLLQPLDGKSRNSNSGR